MMQADQLVLLSDIDGLYTADPRRDPNAAHVPVVPALTPEIEANGWGTAARLLLGRDAHEARRRTHRDARRLRHGDHARPRRAAAARTRARRALHLVPARSRKAAPRANAGSRARWLRSASLSVDAGAARALAAGRSLLPAGVRGVGGSFERGDPVIVLGPDGAALARGLSRLCKCRGAPHCRPSLRRDRGHPRLARARRDDPSRRSGAAVSFGLPAGGPNPPFVPAQAGTQSRTAMPALCGIGSTLFAG